jgi:DNA-directed RNA polymerase subunit RPC12/RpoP
MLKLATKMHDAFLGRFQNLNSVLSDIRLRWRTLVFCPSCGSKIQDRKLLFLTNLNAIRCQVCSSKLRVRNKNVNSVIGGAGGAVGAVLDTLLSFYLVKRGTWRI